MMSVMVTWSLEGSPPCSWKSLLGECSIGLKDLIPFLSHWSDHWSCSNLYVSLQSSPSWSSWDVASISSYCSMDLTFVIHALKISKMVLSVTYCNLGINNPKSCDVWMICDVTSMVYHGEICGCVLCGLSEINMSCFCGGCVYPSVVI